LLVHVYFQAINTCMMQSKKKKKKTKKKNIGNLYSLLSS
jgi:hypothetical protein